MSKENAKKLIAELRTNEELKKKIEGITDPAELVKKAVEAGYDITLAEMLEAEKEVKAETAAKNDELTADELESAAGGSFFSFESDIAKDGHDLSCYMSYHDRDYQWDNKEFCTRHSFCIRSYIQDSFYEERKKRNR